MLAIIVQTLQRTWESGPKSQEDLEPKFVEYNIGYISSKISFIFLNSINVVIQKFLYGETIIYKL